MPHCPLCKADERMVETLKVGCYCNSCGQCFQVTADGRVIRWRTNHEPQRKTDINGHVIDGD